MIQEIATALTVVKNLKDISGRIKDAEFKILLADLQMALADIKVKCADLTEENIRLRRELSRVSESDNVRKNIEFKDGLYYLKTPVEGRPSGPYCPGCLDTHERLQVLRKLPKDFEVFGQFECPICKQNFGKSEMDDFSGFSAT